MERGLSSRRRMTHLLLNELHLHERVPVWCRGALLCRMEVEREDVAVLWRRAALALGIKARLAEGASVTHWVMTLGIPIEQRIYSRAFGMGETKKGEIVDSAYLVVPE